MARTSSMERPRERVGGAPPTASAPWPTASAPWPTACCSAWSASWLADVNSPATLASGCAASWAKGVSMVPALPWGTKYLNGVYSGDTNYSAASSSSAYHYVVGPGSGTLSLSGTPVTSADGNSYTATLDASSNIAPTGSLLITDTNSSTCTSSSWTDQGSDGYGGEIYGGSEEQ